MAIHISGLTDRSTRLITLVKQIPMKDAFIRKTVLGFRPNVSLIEEDTFANREDVNRLHFFISRSFFIL
jgi:hypothetical protein